LAERDIHEALKRYWGYDSFRPMQERIIQNLLAGNDAAVVMPTGGGISLCYQLPALVLGQTVVVVSPLIALLQRSGNATGRHWYSGGDTQQQPASGRAAQGHARRGPGRIPAALPLAGTPGAAGHSTVAATGAGGIFRY
jgi:hypothetical protein